jgi:hypothetical protein
LNQKFCADFETTTDKNDCRVWAAGLINIYTQSFIYTNNINDFMEKILNINKATIYFHNLKFDGEFILYWLFENGFIHTKTRHPDKKEFTTLISDKGVFYSMEICYNNNIIKIIDSLKILPFKVESLPKMFGIKDKKLTIDYNEKREIGHILTKNEVDYLKNDVTIVAKALKILFDEGHTKMTQGSNALNDYKKTIGTKNFKKWFPPPDYDKDIRQSYRGGFTYVNPKFKGKIIKDGLVFDVNSLYPSVMRYESLPLGEGIYYEGEYKNDRIYNLYVQMIRCQFEIKKGFIPTIQLKNLSIFKVNEYIESSGDEMVTLCLTSIDLDIFLKHYNVYNLEYLCGWKFRSSKNLFNDYIDKWYSVKEKATKENNAGMRTLAKLMLNALYGKFGLNPTIKAKLPYYSDGLVKYEIGLPENRTPIYIPMATFITAYARKKTISSAQKLYDRFIYADTDSLHLLGTDIPKEIEIHPTKLGAWKLEDTFNQAKFLRQKCYIEKIKDNLKITCAGMPEACHKYVTFNNFSFGNHFKGKLQQKRVKGGIVLLDIDFTLKE